MIHGLITFFVCLAISLFELPSLLMFLPVAFYIGREFTQAEYRYIETHGRKRALMPWYAPFLPLVWNVKSFTDFMIPLVVAVAMYLLQCFN